MHPPDTLLPDLLPAPRTCRTVTHADCLWLRTLDVCRAIQARTHQAPGSLVLQVRDPAGFTDGRYLLSTQGGAAGRRTDHRHLHSDPGGPRPRPLRG
ncbi:hypothetical protein [Streptomyces sp. x-80]|uniref:hypothetical protein n=1 Tax=Streptomyces sp. x-80 TaxID=2789282 RepID=UPI0039808DFA